MRRVSPDPILAALQGHTFGWYRSNLFRIISAKGLTPRNTSPLYTAKSVGCWNGTWNTGASRSMSACLFNATYVANPIMVVNATAPHPDSCFLIRVQPYFRIGVRSPLIGRKCKRPSFLLLSRQPFFHDGHAGARAEAVGPCVQ